MDMKEACNLLSNTDRQHILHELIESDGVSTISDLAQRIASFSEASEENDMTLKRAKVSLVHNHLPRLEDHGVIEYDTRSGDVILTDAGEVGPLLNTVEELEIAVAKTA
jgi:predicted transcriptional regulator